ncbi:hypothetical protein [Streptomyces sp. NPDC087300]|uniref:hypothetical protein n=1 Tax=Streptomyces sp. NPDC087300 TaxID=3365780 RepID=UPI00382F6DD7
MTTETSTETQPNTEPQEAPPARSGLAARLSGAGRHRGQLAEHDEATAPRGRHRKQDETS